MGQDRIRALQPARTFGILAGPDERLEDEGIGVGVARGRPERARVLIREPPVGELLGTQVGQGRCVGRVIAGRVQRHQGNRGRVGVTAPDGDRGGSVAPAAVGILERLQLGDRSRGHVTATGSKRQDRECLGESRAAAVCACAGVVERREPSHQVAARKLI